MTTKLHDEGDVSSRSLAWYLKSQSFPEPVFNYRFDETRRWRFDLAWPEYRVAVEIDGGIFVHGRHTRGFGFRRDLQKLNYATVQGWKVLRFTPDQIGNRQTWDLIAKLLRFGNPGAIPFFSYRL